jgi:uncharacterized protein (TIGR02646 family)
MHYLDRRRVERPKCLNNADEGRSYKHLRGNETEQIRAALLELQGYRCAYCECRTGDQRDQGHIEHFYDQSGHSDLSLEWTNMYWSCLNPKTCGKHKDECRKQAGRKRKFRPDEIIKPSSEDPEMYLFFVADGSIQPRTGLDETGIYRAMETIRVFNLEDAVPAINRTDAIHFIKNTVEMLLAEEQLDLLRLYVDSQLKEAERAPFGTAIKHFFGTALV